MYPQELDNSSRRPERSVVSGGDDALCGAKVLQAAPSLADNEFGFWPPKRIAAVALQIRLVVFRFCDPFEDLVGQDVFTELGDFDLNTADDIFWDEYYLQSAVEQIIGTLFSHVSMFSESWHHQKIGSAGPGVPGRSLY